MEGMQGLWGKRKKMKRKCLVFISLNAILILYFD
jgi:hypothetical protein